LKTVGQKTNTGTVKPTGEAASKGKSENVVIMYFYSYLVHCKGTIHPKRLRQLYTSKSPSNTCPHSTGM